MNRRYFNVQRAFTLVELLVVIVVIIVLATITAALYNDAQTQARDAKIRDAADKFADSIQLLSAKLNAGHPPRGGWGSTSLVAGGKCADGASGFAAYQIGGDYQCTVADAVVSAGYLKPEFFNDMAPNSRTGGTNKQVFMTYNCTSAKYPGAWLLFFTQESPSQEETEAFNRLLSDCGYNPAGTITQRDTYNMRGAVLVPFGYSTYL